ncbi:MAG: hypothetical protein V3571_00525 [Pseudodesulfovibrio sp.]
MKCPQCGKNIGPQTHTCKRCGARIVHESDRMARRITLGGMPAMICGGLLALIGLILLINGAYQMGGLSLGVGLVFVILGKLLR